MGLRIMSKVKRHTHWIRLALRIMQMSHGQTRQPLTLDATTCHHLHLEHQQQLNVSSLVQMYAVLA